MKKQTPKLRSHCAVLVACLLAACPFDASAQHATKRHTPFIEVRLSLSSSATELLTVKQLRRFLSIELNNTGHVAAQSKGPLADHVGYVWIDLPQPDRVLIQARVGARQVATRSFPIREGMRPDVVARLVAIATSEMVRTQARPRKVRRRRPPKPPTPVQIEVRTRNNPALLWTATGRSAWVPSACAWLGGSGWELSFRTVGWRQGISANWLVGTSDAGPMRWIDGGLSVDRSLWLSRTWRFDLGVGAYAATFFLRDATSVGNSDGERDSWTARVSGRLKAERSVGRSAWLGLSVDPGVLLPSRTYVSTSGRSDIRGVFLGLNLSLTLEHRYQNTALVPLAARH